jgi:5-formyltetrahydrofolate cyclo-ligase
VRRRDATVGRDEDLGERRDVTTAEQEIGTWRRAQRRALLALRQAVEPARARDIRDSVARLVDDGVPGLTSACVGFYWPFRGELDLRPLAADLAARGARPALPAVVAKAQPVEFRPWTPGMALAPDAVGIPAPPPGAATRPAILLVPLLGFDEAGYRLGYGGGYYDRTLAALGRKPLAIGVGHALGRLPTIHPQPHDVPMDAIATEDGLAWFERASAKLRRIEGGDDGVEGAASYASPPCFLHELDPSFVGYLSGAETIALLRALLGAGLADARRRAMLNRHIVRLGGAPDNAAAPPPHDAPPSLLAGLRAALPRLYDEALAADLGDMLRDCARSAPAAGRR